MRRAANERRTNRAYKPARATGFYGGKAVQELSGLISLKHIVGKLVTSEATRIIRVLTSYIALKKLGRN